MEERSVGGVFLEKSVVSRVNATRRILFSLKRTSAGDVLRVAGTTGHADLLPRLLCHLILQACHTFGSPHLRALVLTRLSLFRFPLFRTLQGGIIPWPNRLLEAVCAGC